MDNETGTGIVTAEWPCGCVLEGVTRPAEKGGTWWVPLTACPEHCPCIGCRRIRAAGHVRRVLAAHRPIAGFGREIVGG